jgi:hypothetical protein
MFACVRCLVLQVVTHIVITANANYKNRLRQVLRLLIWPTFEVLWQA